MDVCGGAECARVLRKPGPSFFLIGSVSPRQNILAQAVVGQVDEKEEEEEEERIDSKHYQLGNIPDRKHT